MLIKAGFQLIVGLIMLVMIPINSAVAWPTRDHFNEMYQDCVTREGGYLTNGIILICTNTVLTEVIDRLDRKVELMVETNNFGYEEDNNRAYDVKQRALFVEGVENYQASTEKICDFMGYHVGSPANPLCVMDMMVNVLTILERYD